MKGSRDLGRLLDPRSVAVVGATDAEGRPGRIVLEMVRASGRVLHAVNPGKKEVLGQPAVSRVSDLPGDVDLAIITTAARPAVEAAEECARHGIPYLIVMAGGFGETGEEGRALESRLRAIPASTGTRILGPNSLGVFLPSAKMDTIFVEHGDRALAGGGSVAFVTQSGSVGVESLGLASNTGFGMYAFVGLGNKCDLDEVDFLRHFGRDPHVRCLAFYLESLDRGRDFLREARLVARDKPVVVLKAGRGVSAASAVSSHTGRLAGSSLVAAGAFRQFGILSVLDDEELCDAAKTLAGLPLPRGNRVAIVTPAGGYGVMAADYVESRPARSGAAHGRACPCDREGHPRGHASLCLLQEPRGPDGERGRRHVRQEHRRDPGGSRRGHPHLHRFLRPAADQRRPGGRDRAQGHRIGEACARVHPVRAVHRRVPAQVCHRGSHRLSFHPAGGARSERARRACRGSRGTAGGGGVTEAARGWLQSLAVPGRPDEQETKALLALRGLRVPESLCVPAGASARR